MSSQDLSLGKLNKTVTLTGFKGGIKREQLKTDKEKSIFDKVDTNKDGVIDDAEMTNFTQELGAAAASKKDETNLSNKEAKQYLKDQGLKDVKKEDLFNFVETIAQSSENIKSCTMQDGVYTIMYNDGTQETINPDKSSEVTKKDKEGNTSTTNYNPSHEVVKESELKANGKDSSTTSYEVDSEGNVVKDNKGNSVLAETNVVTNEGQDTEHVIYENGKPKESTVTTESGKNSTHTIYENGVAKEVTVSTENGKNTTHTVYENGVKKEETISEDNGAITRTTQYDSNGRETSAVETQGQYTVKNYTYVNGKPVETSRIENKGLDNEKVTKFTYNQDGSVLETITEKGGKETVRLTKDGKPVAEETKDGDKVSQRRYEADGSSVEIVRDGEKSVTRNEINAEGHRTTSVKQCGNKQYQLQYDGNGNTEGIIVQCGETPASIAKKFGVPLNKLLEANADKVQGKKNKYFRVGDSIKIPREMEADEKVLQGRDSSEVAVAKYKKQLEAQERDRQLRALGLKNYKRAGEKFEYGGVKYTVLGTMTNRERLLVVDPKGNINFASHDNLILKDEYVQNTNIYDFGKKMKAADGKEYVVVQDRNDGHGRKIVVDANGKANILSGGKSQTDFSDRVLLRTDYVEASDLRDLGQAKSTVSGGDGVTYVKDHNGKVWYFDEKTGKALVKEEYSNFVQKEADAITNTIYGAAKGMGTDEEALQKGVGQIYSSDILARVNTSLAAKDSDYKGDADTMPLEALILDEETHGNSRKYFRTLINSGAMSTEQSATTVRREIEHEVHGGVFGYTSTADLNEVMNLVPNRDVRLEIESQMGSKHTNLKADNGSIVRAYISGDGWNAQEVDQFDANWVANKAYAPGLDQEHRNGVIGRLCFKYDDKEALHKGLKACDDDPDSEDYKFLSARATIECKNKDYQTQFTGQESVQQYLAGRATEDGKVNVEQLSACNSLLFKTEKPARVQAEEALYNAKSGDMSQVFNSMDPEVYDKMAEIAQNGDIPGCTSVKDLYDKAMKQANSNEQPSIQANAILSGHVKFSDKQITDFCVSLMHQIDSNAGLGSSSGYSAGYSNQADYQTEQLKAILEQHPEIINDVKALVEKGEFKSTTVITSGGTNGVPATRTSFTTDTKASYLDILNKSNGIVKDEVFLDENGKRITDPAQIEKLKEQNNEALKGMREYVAQLEREFKVGLDEEGWLDDAGNALVRYSGIGTDRGDVYNRYVEAKRQLRQLEAAANGRLRDANGNVISAQTIAQRFIDTDNLAEVNGNYKSSVGMAKMGIVLAPVIAVTTVATMGTGATGWAAVGVAAGATATVEGGMYGSNLLTSETGNTAENRAAVASQVAQDTVLAAAGVKFGQYAENFAVHGIQAVSGAERQVFAPQTWKIISKVPEGKVKDLFSTAAKYSAKLEQTAANVGASAISKQASLIKSLAPNISQKTLERSAVILARVEATGLEITSDSVQSLLQMYVVDGEIDDEAFLQGAILSAVGNSIGHATNVVGEFKSAGSVPIPKVEVNTGNERASAILAGRQGGLGEGDAAILREHLKNNLNSVEDIEHFIADVRTRVGVDPNGKMHVYEVAGKDQAADLIRQAESKMNKIKANQADFAAANQQLDNAITAGRGLSETEYATVKAYFEKTNSVEELQSFIDKMKANKNLRNSHAAKRLLRDMEEKVGVLKAKASAGAVATHNTSETSAPRQAETPTPRPAETPAPRQAETPAPKQAETPTPRPAETPAGVNEYGQKPSFTQYSEAELKEMFESQQLNGRRFTEIIDDNYDDLRLSGHYSEESSINGNFEDIQSWNYNPSEGVRVRGGLNDWIWHEFDNGCKGLGNDRVSLSVKADRQMMEELDQLLLTGKYTDASGNVVTIPRDKFTKGMYKTDITVEDWCKRHDPITMYFDETVSDEMLQAISTVTEKYKRVPERVLSGAVDGKPWMAHEHYTTTKEVEDLIAEARKVNPELADAISSYCYSPREGRYNASTGMYASCQKLLDDYKQYKGITTGSTRGAAAGAAAGAPKVETPKVETPTPEQGRVQFGQTLEDTNTNLRTSASNVNEAQIPSNHKQRWAQCKQSIENLFADVKDFASVNISSFSARCKSIIANLDTIIKDAGAEIKAQLQALKQSVMDAYSSLMAQINSSVETVSKRRTAVPKFEDLPLNDRQAIENLWDIYHSDLQDPNLIRAKYPQYAHLSDAELLNEFKLDKDHAAFVRGRKDLFRDGQNKYTERPYWSDSMYEQTNNHSAWKMHLYSVEEQDWQKMASVVIPYLNEHKIAHKTLSSTMSPELLAKTAPKQTGKAFTIYPQSQAEMEMIARDLDKLIRDNNLTLPGSHIVGDNNLGSTGRLFYRYELSSGQFKNEIFAPGDRRVYAYYDSNRGEGRYLAADMTEADDPWRHFDPADPNSKVGTQYEPMDMAADRPYRQNNGFVDSQHSSVGAGDTSVRRTAQTGTPETQGARPASQPRQAVAAQAYTIEPMESLSSKVKQACQNIADIDIPANCKKLWNSCTSKIDGLMNKMATLTGNIDFSALAVEYKTIIGDLDSLCSNVSSSVRTKLREIKQKLSNAFDSFLLKNGKRIEKTGDFLQGLDDKDKARLGEIVDDVRHIAEDPTNIEHWAELGEDAVVFTGDKIYESQAGIKLSDAEEIGEHIAHVVTDPSDAEAWLELANDAGEYAQGKMNEYAWQQHKLAASGEAGNYHSYDLYDDSFDDSFHSIDSYDDSYHNFDSFDTPDDFDNGFVDDIDFGIIGGSGGVKNYSIPKYQEVSIGNDKIVYFDENRGACFIRSTNGSFGAPKKVKPGESVVLSKDASGNYYVASADIHGNVSVTIQKNAPEVSGANRPSAPTRRTSASETPVQQRPSSSSSTSETRKTDLSSSWNDVATTAEGNSIKARISDDTLVINKNGKVHELDLPEAGERYAIRETSTDTYLIVERGLDGKVSITTSKTDITAEASVQPRAQVETPAQTRRTSATTPTDNTKVSDRMSVENLAQLRAKSPAQYDQITRRELSQLRVNNPQQYEVLDRLGVISGLTQRGASISERTLNAIHLVNQGKTLVTTIPDNVNLSNISSHVGNGEVCSHRGSLYVNNNGKAVKLDMSQEAFEKLFPPIESSIIKQPTSSEDCWLLSTMSAQMDTPQGRVELYKRFRQVGDDIYVSTPNKPDVKFSSGKVLSAPGLQSETCDGLKMVEMTAAVHRTSRIENGHTVTLTPYYEKGADVVDINKILTPTFMQSLFSSGSQATNVNNLLSRLNRGNERYALSTLGGFQSKSFAITTNPASRDALTDMISQYANNPNFAIIHSSAVGVGMNNQLGMYFGHGTKIVGYDNGFVHFVDQMQHFGGSGIVRRLPLESFLDMTGHITITDFSLK